MSTVVDNFPNRSLKEHICVRGSCLVNVFPHLLGSADAAGAFQLAHVVCKVVRISIQLNVMVQPSS